MPETARRPLPIRAVLWGASQADAGLLRLNTYRAATFRLAERKAFADTNLLRAHSCLDILSRCSALPLTPSKEPSVALNALSEQPAFLSEHVSDLIHFGLTGHGSNRAVLRQMGRANQLLCGKRSSAHATVFLDRANVFLTWGAHAMQADGQIGHANNLSALLGLHETLRTALRDEGLAKAMHSKRIAMGGQLTSGQLAADILSVTAVCLAACALLGLPIAHVLQAALAASSGVLALRLKERGRQMAERGALVPPAPSDRAANSIEEIQNDPLAAPKRAICPDHS